MFQINGNLDVDFQLFWNFHLDRRQREGGVEPFGPDRPVGKYENFDPFISTEYDYDTQNSLDLVVRGLKCNLDAFNVSVTKRTDSGIAEQQR